MSAASRRKGRRWESAVAAWLRTTGLFPHAEPRSTGMAGSPDIVGVPFTIEAKCRKDIASAICEGLDSACAANRGPTLPVVIAKRPRHPDVADAYAVMRLADWAQMAAAWDAQEAGR